MKLFWKVLGWFVHIGKLSFTSVSVHQQYTVEHQVVLVLADAIERAGMPDEAWRKDLKKYVQDLAVMRGVEERLNKVVKKEVEDA